MLYAFIFQPLFWVLVVPFIAFSAYASFRVKRLFGKYHDVPVRRGITGAQAAAAVLRSGGAEGCAIEEHPGFLSDHYDPRSRTLRLSPDVYRGRSISSIAVAAHEAGHAIQHAEEYKPLDMRSKLVPLVMIGNQLWVYCTMAFFLFGSLGASGAGGSGTLFLDIGIVVFFVTVLFQLVTLPVEFDASNRAKAVLASSGIVSTPDEERGVSKVLGAAAMTYVAGLLTAVAQLVMLLVLRGQADD